MEKGGERIWKVKGRCAASADAENRRGPGLEWGGVAGGRVRVPGLGFTVE